MALTFVGGVYVNENKNARKSPIEPFPPPKIIKLPLLQHIGTPAVSIVQVGDIVAKGQMIAVADSELSCHVHSSVSGIVTDISNGIITIENDYNDTFHSSIRPFEKKITETSTDEIIDVIKQAGIAECDMAKSMPYPLYAKLQAAVGKVGTLIINGAESEPYMCSVHRLMLEQPDYVINGAKILLKALGLKKCIIAVEDNKLDAVNTLNTAAKKSKLIEVKTVRTKYPQSDERCLIYALTGKQIPFDKSSIEREYAVVGVESVVEICRTFAEGMPSVDRIITVDGNCGAKARNLRVPLGTPISDIFAYCELKKQPSKIVIGGAMTGMELILDNINAPITKGMSALLAFSSNLRRKNEQDSPCIRCGRCAESCPMRLQPLYLSMFAQKEDIESCKEYDALSCIECGCCEYICPANIEIIRHIKNAKEHIHSHSQKDIEVTKI